MNWLTLTVLGVVAVGFEYNNRVWCPASSRNKVDIVLKGHGFSRAAKMHI